LAGVNDGNLVELARRLGVRVSLRGDMLMLQGALPAVERAAQVAQALVELARMGETLDVADVDRIVSDEAQGSLGRPAEGEYKIILPGLRRVIQPKTAGQREYLQAIVQHDIVIGIGPAGTGKTYLAVAAAVDARGRTLADAFVILDEAQNATGMQMKMFLTRLGVNSRAVITGDKTQIDLANREDSGLLQVERILPGIEGIGFCYLADTDVVRHRLVRDIIRAYAEDAQG